VACVCLRSWNRAVRPIFDAPTAGFQNMFRQVSRGRCPDLLTPRLVSLRGFLSSPRARRLARTQPSPDDTTGIDTARAHTRWVLRACRCAHIRWARCDPSRQARPRPGRAQSQAPLRTGTTGRPDHPHSDGVPRCDPEPVSS
jgi:hypothetical protein